jgi:hypothetical protein
MEERSGVERGGVSIRADADEGADPQDRARSRRVAELLLWILLPLPILFYFERTTITLSRDRLRFDAQRYAAMAESRRLPPVTDELLERGRAAHRSRKVQGTLSQEEQQALLSRLPPFCWRVLTPWLASLVPSEDTVASFKLVAGLGTWLSLILLCLFLRSCGLPPRSTIAGLVLYALCYHGVEFGFRNPVYPDYMTQAFLVGGLLLVARGRHWTLLPWLALGMLQKESLLCLAPVALIDHGRRHGWWRASLFVYGLALVALPLATLTLVRWLIPPVAEFEQAGSLWLLFTRMIREPTFWPRFAIWTVVGLGMALPLVLLQAGACWRYLRPRPQWLALIAIGFVFLWAGDKARLYLYMLPVVVLLAAWTMQPAAEGRSPVGWIWVVGTLALAFHLEGMRTEHIDLLTPETSIRVQRLLRRMSLLLLAWTAASLWLERAGLLPTRHAPRLALGVERTRQSLPR